MKDSMQVAIAVILAGSVGPVGPVLGGEQGMSGQSGKHGEGSKTGKAAAGRSSIEGEVLRIQGDDYVIKDSSGGEVRLRVNKETHINCAAAGQGGGKQDGMSGAQQASRQGEGREMIGEHELQRQSGHYADKRQQGGAEADRQNADLDENAAMGLGHLGPQREGGQGQTAGGSTKMGTLMEEGSKGKPRSAKDGDARKRDCELKAGDHVRAEVSDRGTATMIKQISDAEQRPSGSPQ